MWRQGWPSRLRSIPPHHYHPVPARGLHTSALPRQPNALLNVWPLPLRHEWHEALNGRAGAAARVPAAPGPRFSRGARRKSSAARRPRAAVARGANRKRRASARPAWHPAAPARLRRKPVAPLEALGIISRRHRGGTCRRARGSPVLLHGGGADSSFYISRNASPRRWRRVGVGQVYRTSK